MNKGEKVISPVSGKEVEPSDVISPPIPGPISLIIDCPSFSYLPSLLSHPSWKFYSSSHNNDDNDINDINDDNDIKDTNDNNNNNNNNNEKNNYASQVAVIIHFTPIEIVRDAKYQLWLSSFSPSAKVISFPSFPFPISFSNDNYNYG